MPGACSFRSVEPPSIMLRPERMRLCGRFATWKDSTSDAARVLASTISREQGMYLVTPVVVPDVTAK